MNPGLPACEAGTLRLSYIDRRISFGLDCLRSGVCPISSPISQYVPLAICQRTFLQWKAQIFFAVIFPEVKGGLLAILAVLLNTKKYYMQVLQICKKKFWRS